MSRIAPQTPILAKDKRVRDKKHLAFIADLPCVICWQVPVECAHVRMAGEGKGYTAKGRKPSDRWVLPLCPSHHRTGPDAQHRMSERAWWEKHGKDPIALCKALYAVSGDVGAGHKIVWKSHPDTDEVGTVKARR